MEKEDRRRKTKDERSHRGMCIWQDGGQPVTKKQEQKEQDCEE